MDYLPNNPAILVSSINMYLRDGEFDTLQSLCNCYNRDVEQLKAYLRQNGYEYDEAQKQFKAF